MDVITYPRCLYMTVKGAPAVLAPNEWKRDLSQNLMSLSVRLGLLEMEVQST